MALVERNNNASDRYSLVEDAVIVAMFKRETKPSIKEASDIMKELGFDRSVSSVRYRITQKLGTDEVNSFSDLHKSATPDQIKAAEKEANEMLANLATS